MDINIYLYRYVCRECFSSPFPVSEFSRNKIFTTEDTGERRGGLKEARNAAARTRKKVLRFSPDDKS